MKKLAGDKTVGRLIKWLRIFGLPCEMKEIKTASEIPEDTIFLTRARRLASSNTIILISDKIEDQLKELFERLPALEQKVKPFTLCIRCNTLLENIPKEETLGLVPDYIYETHHSFKRCPVCGRIYWPGTHQQRMNQKLFDFLQKTRNKDFSFFTNWPKK
ncbi:Mut7-C RNAse domain-containing protein [Thermodesulfatator atlanticus]